MGIFSTGIGFNLTNNDPLQKSPFVENIFGVSSVNPGGDFLELLDDGSEFLLLDDNSDFLLLDA